ncbi:MAG: nicotinate phosphoribosyltransferase [Clostridiales bacterium]|nr:nicotinate phosphoribosyltransferase [Clostridiales bacterium]MDD7035544.1 nicotinate phosphoribosyltransferase [Bacillota bacterium]MDY2919872.1 nicotinate phosphoribosyltransferase [Lentihominibacter sp.]
MIEKINLTMLTDFYEITMANGYFEAGMSDEIAYFDMFFRRIPDEGGYAIMAGLEQVIEYLKGLEFDDEDIEYLRSKGIFSDKFLEYLKNFKFTCDVWAVPEGTPIFPYEPIITVRGPVMQAQFVETMILLLVNHQSLIATKASRIVRAAEGRPVMEFGTRRAHSTTAAVYGARASYIGGCAGTACTIADREFGTPALGTMAHSWVQMFDNEYEAFKTYVEQYPTNATLLVDTYNVLKSGVPAAIKVFKELDPPNKGIRIDSGDIAYLTKKARKMLDDAGLEDCKIVISNSLDEYIIRDVIQEGACIDSFGVGERMITAKSEPVFGGVYKLAAVEVDGKLIPKIKVSENVEKITTPGFKTLYRLFDKDTNRALCDIIALDGEEIPEVEEYEIFDPNAVWKRKKISNYYVKNLRKEIFRNGECVYESPSIDEIKSYCAEQLDLMWDEMKRFENPQTYYVDLSYDLWKLKNDMIEGTK